MKIYRFILALVLVGVASCVISAQETDSKHLMAFGVAFYNLENLFDTIPNNPLGRDLEFTPNGDNKWDSAKYNTKLKNMAYAISQMKTKVTPLGPACIGVSEIENRSVLEDLVKQESIKDLNLQVIHHDSTISLLFIIRLAD